MLDARDVDDLLRAMETLTPAPVLVTLDTLARTMVGGDENAAVDMGRYVHAADRLRRTIGCTVLVVHHSDRASSIRGSSGLPAALDTETRADRDWDGVILTCGKQRDAEPFGAIVLATRKVPLADGASSLVSLVLESGAATDRLTAAERPALAVLCGTFGARGGTYTAWESACGYHKVPHSTFDRARTGLLAKGWVVPSGKGRGSRLIPSPEALAECQGTTEVPR